MKNSLPTNPFYFKFMVLAVAFMLVLFYNKARANSQSPAPQNWTVIK